MLWLQRNKKYQSVRTKSQLSSVRIEKIKNSQVSEKKNVRQMSREHDYWLPRVGFPLILFPVVNESLIKIQRF